MIGADDNIQHHRHNKLDKNVFLTVYVPNHVKIDFYVFTVAAIILCAQHFCHDSSPANYGHRAIDSEHWTKITHHSKKKWMQYCEHLRSLNNTIKWLFNKHDLFDNRTECVVENLQYLCNPRGCMNSCPLLKLPQIWIKTFTDASTFSDRHYATSWIVSTTVPTDFLLSC